MINAFGKFGICLDQKVTTFSNNFRPFSILKSDIEPLKYADILVWLDKFNDIMKFAIKR